MAIPDGEPLDKKPEVKSPSSTPGAPKRDLMDEEWLEDAILRALETWEAEGFPRDQPAQPPNPPQE